MVVMGPFYKSVDHVEYHKVNQAGVTEQITMEEGRSMIPAPSLPSGPLMPCGHGSCNCIATLFHVLGASVSWSVVLDGRKAF